ncbi:MAG TPA: hypothetical protein VKT80_04095 [Chloroflexota bacterium]|nr:hypothetical protein [Chloroflexota bacterium]
MKEQVVKVFRSVVGHAARQDQVVATRDDVQGIDLDGLDLAQRQRRPSDPGPSSPRPETLATQDELAHCRFGKGQWFHRRIAYNAVRSG